MELKDLTKEIYLPEYSQIMKDKTYIELIEKYKAKEKQLRKDVFALYTKNWFTENQIYNEKNANVEVLSVLLDVKEDIKEVKAPWIKYLNEVLDWLIKSHTDMIETRIWGLATWITMSIYTETDIMLRRANTYVDIYNFYDKTLEWFRKWEEGKEEEKEDEVF